MAALWRINALEEERSAGLGVELRGQWGRKNFLEEKPELIPPE